MPKKRAKKRTSKVKKSTTRKYVKVRGYTRRPHKVRAHTRRGGKVRSYKRRKPRR